MKDVKDRNAQFQNIADIREKTSAIGLSIISIDTKKKELIGNFKRDRKVLALVSRNPLTTISGHSPIGQIFIHGIYDVIRNVGYITIGTS